jgi:hypothetical protein
MYRQRGNRIVYPIPKLPTFISPEHNQDVPAGTISDPLTSTTNELISASITGIYVLFGVNVNIRYNRQLKSVHMDLLAYAYHPSQSLHKS